MEIIIQILKLIAIKIRIPFVRGQVPFLDHEDQEKIREIDYTKPARLVKRRKVFSQGVDRRDLS